MLAVHINDDEDTTDEEIEENAKIPDSDTEQDHVVFISDDEAENVESESDYESIDAENLEDSDSSFDEETQAELLTKLKFDKKSNLKKKSKSNEPLVSKSKALAKKDIASKKKSSKHDKSSVTKTQIQKNVDNKDVSKNVNEEDEYEYDSSDEEDIRNTIGKIPLKWYDDYDHIGYNWEGKKIPKPEKGDELDNFLKRMENPDFWRTIKDPQTNQDVVLSEEDIDLIVGIQKQKIPDVQFDEYAVSCSSSLIFVKMLQSCTLYKFNHFYCNYSHG